MKKFFVLSVLVAMAFTALISSCKKDASGCKMIRLYGTDSFNVETISYDGDHMSRVDYRMKTGESQGYSLYHYSSTGKLSGYEDLDSNGVILRKTEYYFNDKDQVVTEKYYVLSSGTLEYSAHYEYEYYDNGNLKKYSRYGTGSTVYETYYYTDYDSKGNNTKGYSNNSLGVTVDTFFITYDDHPNFLSGFNLQTSFAKNNELTHRYKPTIGSENTDVFTYGYNSQGYVIYYHELLDGDDYHMEYSCDN